jgi:hypothetical protein
MQTNGLVELLGRQQPGGRGDHHATASERNVYGLTPNGREKLVTLGVSVEPATRRPLLSTCIDWSERRPHLSGALGASLFEVFLGRGWLRRDQRRVVRVTEAGCISLVAEFGLATDLLG